MSLRTSLFLEVLGRERLVCLEKGVDISGLAGITCCLVLEKPAKLLNKLILTLNTKDHWKSHTRRICSTSSNLHFLHMERHEGGSQSFES